MLGLDRGSDLGPFLSGRRGGRRSRRVTGGLAVGGARLGVCSGARLVVRRRLRIGIHVLIVRRGLRLRVHVLVGGAALGVRRAAAFGLRASLAGVVGLRTQGLRLLTGRSILCTLTGAAARRHLLVRLGRLHAGIGTLGFGPLSFGGVIAIHRRCRRWCAAVR